MKLNVVAFLIKKGVSESCALSKDNRARSRVYLQVFTQINTLLNKDNRARCEVSPCASVFECCALNKDNSELLKIIPISIDGCSFYVKQSLSAPKWSELFIDDGVYFDIFRTTSVNGLLFVNIKCENRIENRLLAFTFGHGKSMLDLSMIERGFGLRVTLNLGDSERIKSIDKSTIEKAPLKTRTQSSKNTNVNNFKFEFDQEILKSIRAVVEGDNDKHPEIVSGCDSISINTDVKLDSFPDLAQRLLDAYSGDEYKKKYPWVNFIKFITDSSLCGELNQEMVNLINKEKYDEVWITPSEIVDYDNFSEFIYKVKGTSLCVYDELNLSEYIEEAKLKNKVTIDTLKKNSIKIYDAAEQYIKALPVFNCMNFEIKYKKEIYILSDGKWYKVNTDFSKDVESFFKTLIKDSKNTIHFMPYEKSMTEGKYLELVAKGKDNNFALLDGKMINNGKNTNKLEFCDLLYQRSSPKCKAFIHVKKYVASSTLSHLFAQASVSAEFLMNNPTRVQNQVNKHLGNKEDLQVNFDSKDSIRNYKVVLAIMQPYKRKLQLPFFSKVHLRHHVRRLQNMGFKVELAKIDPKQTVFYSFHYKDIQQATQIYKMGKLNANSTSNNKWKIEGNKPASDNEWNKNKSSEEIKERINELMADKFCVVVLIGEHTASCEWVKYAIKEAWNRGKGVVGIDIYNLTDSGKERAIKGKDPFEGMVVEIKKREIQLSRVVKRYDGKKTGNKDVCDIIKGKLPTWIEEAIKIRNKYEETDKCKIRIF